MQAAEIVMINREASPLGLPYTLTRSPLRRLAPFACVVKMLTSHASRVKGRRPGVVTRP